MNKVPFQKFHGFGNDYIVVTTEHVRDVADIHAFTRTISHRNTGAGSDGIALLEKLDSETADYSCRIINPDGSEAGFSGNGTRCAVAYLYREELWSDSNLRLKTKSGIKNYDFIRREKEAFWFLAELGKPVFNTELIPFKRSMGATDLIEFKSDDLIWIDTQKRFPYLALNVGNPVCVVFMDEFDLDWRLMGAAIESHPCFVERTNVVFVTAINESNIDIRIWERGAGETSSSGTCSIAAAVASAFTERTVRKVKVHAKGGITEALWRDDAEMLITGSAEYVYSGEWPLSG
jgi:diaminopimelate epimerase